MYDNRVRVLEIDHVNLINRQMEIDKDSMEIYPDAVN